MRVALTLLLLIAATAGPALSAADAHPLHIVVLRLEDVLRNAKLYSVRMEGLKKEKADADAKLKQFSEQQQQLDNQIQALNPGNEHYFQAAEDAEVIKVRAKFYMDRARAVLERKNATALKECYATVRATLKDYCREKGIDLVELAPNPEVQANPENIQLQLGLQTVLFYDPSLDITDAFTSYLNARYAAEASAPTPLPGPVPAPLPGPVAAPAAAPAPVPAPAQPTGK